MQPKRPNSTQRAFLLAMVENNGEALYPYLDKLSGLDFYTVGELTMRYDRFKLMQQAGWVRPIPRESGGTARTADRKHYRYEITNDGLAVLHRGN